jgi:outer membrane autotransporter protein
MLAVSDLAISSGTVTVLTATGGVTALDLGLIASPALQASLAYPNANDVQISYAVSFAPAGIGLNANQSALGTHLNDAVLADPTSLADITSALLTVTTDEDYFSALDQLSPEPYGDAAVSTLNGAHTFGNALMSCRKRDAAYVGVSEGECLWAAASGRIYEQDATASGLGYEEDTWGVAGGGQVSIAPGLVLGLAGGYERSDADTTTGASTETDRGYAGAVLKHTSGRWLVAGAAFGGWSATETTRPIAIGPLATTATGEQDVPHLSGRLRVAYQAGGNAFYAKPMVDLEVTHLWFGSVREQGSPAALSIASSEETFFSAAPAIEFGGEVPLADGAVLLPFVRAGAIFYSEDSLAFSSAFAGAPSGVSSFLTQSEVDDVMGSVGAGLEVMWTDASVLKLYYDGAFGSDTRLHGFGGKASVKF